MATDTQLVAGAHTTRTELDGEAGVLAGAGCTPEKDFMPDGPSMTARVRLVDQDVGLLTETKGEPCYELRTDVVKGAEASLGQYGCLQARDALSVDFLVYPDYEAPAASGFTTPVLVVHERLAVGGAVDSPAGSASQYAPPESKSARPAMAADALSSVVP